MNEQGQDRNHIPADSPSRSPIRHDISGCLAARVGAHGLSPNTHASYLSSATDALTALRAAHQSGDLPMLDQCSGHEDLDSARAALDRLSANARTIIFLGTGSVCVAAEALAQLAGWNIPGAADAAQKKRPRTRFYDNLDPLTLQGMLSGVDPAATRFVFLSPDGRNSETLAQAMIIVAALKSAGLAQQLPELMLGISQPDCPDVPNHLRNLFATHGVPVLDLPAGAEGAFAILSTAALLPAMARGFDAHVLRQAADDTLVATLSCTAAADCPPADAAATMFALAAEHDIRTLVVMPFADRLEKLAAWFANMWLAGAGPHQLAPTPLAALGPRDCDSLLPLLQYGRREYVTTLLHVPAAGTGNTIDAELAGQTGANDLTGRAVGDLIASRSQALANTLVEAGRPVRCIHLANLNEEAIGTLIMHVMLEALLFAQLAKAKAANG